jgi:hypothetical protein
MRSRAECSLFPGSGGIDGCVQREGLPTANPIIVASYLRIDLGWEILHMC